MYAHFGGVLFSIAMCIYIYASLKIQNGLSIGSLSGSTWTEKMGVSGSTGNISTNGTITAAGNINGKNGSFTGIGKTYNSNSSRGVYWF